MYEFWFFLRKCTNIGASRDVPDVPRRTSVPAKERVDGLGDDADAEILFALVQRSSPIVDLSELYYR